MTLITALFINLVLLGVLLNLQILFRTTNHGLGYALSNLDKNNPKSVLEDRVLRVKNNQVEFLILITPLILIAMQSQTALSHASAIALALVIGRVAYVIVALAGIPVLRSATWLIGFIAWAFLLVQVGLTAIS